MSNAQWGEIAGPQSSIEGECIMAQNLDLIAILLIKSPFLEPDGMLYTWDGLLSLHGNHLM